MPAPTPIVSVYAREIVRLEAMPHGSLALTIEKNGERTAVLLDRGTLNLILRQGNRRAGART